MTFLRHLWHSAYLFFNEPIKRGWALLGYLLLTGGIILAIALDSQHTDDARQAVVQSGRAVSVVGCNRDFRTIMVLRGILSGARDTLETRHREGEITDRQMRRARDFYREQISALRLPDCREAFEIVNDDPSTRHPVPDPLFSKRSTLPSE